MSVRSTGREEDAEHEHGFALSATFRALDRARVRWCLLRGTDDAGLEGDIDLLVAANDRADLARVLREQGFIRLPSWGYGTHTFFLRRAQDLDRWIKLDVVTELAYGPGFSLRTRSESACLARRRRSGDTWVLDPEDELFALLLHRLLDKRTLDDRSLHRLRELFPPRSADGPLLRALAASAPIEWPAARILDAAARGDRIALERDAGPALARSWARREGSRAVRRRMAERISRATAKVATAWRRPGLAVALLGPDGAGKTTLAAGLRDASPLPVRSIYFAPSRVHEDRPRRRLPGIGLALRLLGLWRGWVVGRAHVARGRLVLFDRYPLDARLAPRRPLTPAERLRRWIVGHSCPAPELVLVLDVPGAVAYARKRELDPATLESERHRYRELAHRIPGAVVLDASRDPEELRRHAFEIVWRAWSSRWRPR